MIDWFGNHKALLGWLGAASALTFVGTLVLIPILVVRMQSDYFMHRKPDPESWRGQHPAVRMTVLVIKNTLGIALVLAGIVLSLPLIPGQGILTILIGISLVNFPGKRRLELRLVRLPAVRAAINWMRAKAHHPPLQLPEP